MDRSFTLPDLIESLEERRLLSAAWGPFPQLIGLDALASNFPAIDGRGESIAVIDTGVDWHHPELGGGCGPGHKVVAGWDFVDNDPDPMDSDGHGTGVAGIIAAGEFTYGGALYRGIASGANIVARRVDDSNSDDQVLDSRIEAALQWVIAHRQQHNIVAVNMSLGSGEYSGPVARAPYGDELAALAGAGVLISAAAGNNGVQSPPAIEYPAADPNVYAIGSVNSSDVISAFTERSSDLDLLAPGENVPTPYYDPARGRPFYVAATGTSFASPAVAAAAALIRQVQPNLTPGQIIKILQDSGSPNLDGDRESGLSTGLTFPRINLDRALQAATAMPDSGNDLVESNNSLGAATTHSSGAAVVT